jgi:hypothetical protein
VGVGATTGENKLRSNCAAMQRDADILAAERVALTAEAEALGPRRARRLCRQRTLLRRRPSQRLLLIIRALLIKELKRTLHSICAPPSLAPSSSRACGHGATHCYPRVRRSAVCSRCTRRVRAPHLDLLSSGPMLVVFVANTPRRGSRARNRGASRCVCRACLPRWVRLTP